MSMSPKNATAVSRYTSMQDNRYSRYSLYNAVAFLEKSHAVLVNVLAVAMLFVGKVFCSVDFSAGTG